MRPVVPDAQEDYYRLETMLFDGLQDNDLSGYNKEQVINDILDKYERHRTFLHINRETPGSRPVCDEWDQPCGWSSYKPSASAGFVLLRHQ